MLGNTGKMQNSVSGATDRCGSRVKPLRRIKQASVIIQGGHFQCKHNGIEGLQCGENAISQKCKPLMCSRPDSVVDTFV